jgi:plasmid stability protein
MLGWFVVALAGALGVRAHVQAVSTDNARRAALRAAASTEAGRTTMAAASNAALFLFPPGRT